MAGRLVRSRTVTARKSPNADLRVPLRGLHRPHPPPRAPRVLKETQTNHLLQKKPCTLPSSLLVSGTLVR